MKPSTSFARALFASFVSRLENQLAMRSLDINFFLIAGRVGFRNPGGGRKRTQCLLKMFRVSLVVILSIW
jgi:hypothetical protein